MKPKTITLVQGESVFIDNELYKITDMWQKPGTSYDAVIISESEEFRVDNEDIDISLCDSCIFLKEGRFIKLEKL